jgi:peptidoglycan hydrolase-like protein with peptidoglycan-binding domain
VQIPTIQPGSKGPDVKAAQSILNGKAGARLAVDGVFGPATETAVKAWQQFFRLDVDGIVGPHTWATLLNG